MNETQNRWKRIRTVALWVIGIIGFIAFIALLFWLRFTTIMEGPPGSDTNQIHFPTYD